MTRFNQLFLLMSIAISMFIVACATDVSVEITPIDNEYAQIKEDVKLEYKQPNIIEDISLKDESNQTQLKKLAGDLKVHFIAVGQADAMLVQLPNGQNMVVDAGNNSDGGNVVNYIKRQGVSRLDFVIGTHPHEDHIGGLDDVINSFDIEKVYMPKVSHNTKTFEDVLLAIRNKGLRVSSPMGGTAIIDDGNLKVEVVAPNSDTYSNLNDYSIVAKITYGNTSFLLTGDAESTSEREMLSKGFNLKSDVLKIGHHGSHSSTTQEFLSAVSPKYGVIMVGSGNRYGHPHDVILDRLANAGVEVYRTDLDGTIVATSDGNVITFNKKASPIKINAPPILKNNPDGKLVYIGNKNSSIFHKPSCSSLPAEHNRVMFNSREEAINAGHRTCGRCKP